MVAIVYTIGFEKKYSYKSLLHSQKNIKNTKIRFRTLLIFWDAQENQIFRSVKITWRLWTKLLITQKIKITKTGKLIFHSFHNITQQFGPENWDGSFWGGGGSACR